MAEPLFRPNRPRLIEARAILLRRYRDRDRYRYR